MRNLVEDAQADEEDHYVGHKPDKKERPNMVFKCTEWAIKVDKLITILTEGFVARLLEIRAHHNTAAL